MQYLYLVKFSALRRMFMIGLFIVHVMKVTFLMIVLHRRSIQ